MMAASRKIGRFMEKAAGNRGKGRPKGAKGRVPTALKKGILIAAEEVGYVDVETEFSEKGRQIVRRKPTGEGGLVGYLRGLAVDEPVAFAGLLGKVLPTTLAGDPNAPIVHKNLIEKRRAAARQLIDDAFREIGEDQGAVSQMRRGGLLGAVER
jgi:hypothetical protein